MLLIGAVLLAAVFFMAAREHPPRLRWDAGVTGADHWVSETRRELIHLRRLHAPDAHVLAWHVGPEADEIRLVLEHRGEKAMRGNARWQDVSMFVRRAGCSGLMIARAEAPIAVPGRGEARSAWSRWLADPRVELRIWRPSQPLVAPCSGPTGGMDRSDPRILMRSRADRTPVDPCSDR